MKTFVKFVTICLLISFLAACGGAPAAQEPAAPAASEPAAQEPAAPDTTSSEPEMTAAEQWAMENSVGPYTPEIRRLGGDRRSCEKGRKGCCVFQLFQDRKTN